MDSLVLIERLDELMADAKPIPFTHEARVDRDEVYKILDRIRTTLPVEFERVRWLGKEAEQEEGLESKLGEINEAIAELRRAQREHAAGGPPLTVAAAEQVREIIKAAERTAEHVEREANTEAQRMREEAEGQLRRARDEAERHLRETRERAAAEAADYLRRVEEATKKMLERANSAGTEFDGMLQRLRGSGGSVIEELEAIMSGLTEIEVRRTKPAVGSGERAVARAGAEAVSKPAAQRPVSVGRVATGTHRAVPRSPQPRPAAPQQQPRPRRPVAPHEEQHPADPDRRPPAPSQRSTTPEQPTARPAEESAPPFPAPRVEPNPPAEYSPPAGPPAADSPARAPEHQQERRRPPAPGERDVGQPPSDSAPPAA
jgi:cell division septum initiation protein DivIVA